MTLKHHNHYHHIHEHTITTIHKNPLSYTTDVELVQGVIGPLHAYVQVQHLNWLVVQKHLLSSQTQQHLLAMLIVTTTSTTCKIDNHHHIQPPHTSTTTLPPPHSACCMSASEVLASVAGRSCSG